MARGADRVYGNRYVHGSDALALNSIIHSAVTNGDGVAAQLQCRLCSVAEIAVQGGNHLSAFADRPTHPLDRA
jgi:hypothetical protein